MARDATDGGPDACRHGARGASGVETREAASALAGYDVGVPREVLPEARKGEIYWADLIADVVNREGVALGQVCGVTEHGAHPLLRVARAGGRPGRRATDPVRSGDHRPRDLEAKQVAVDWGEDY
jgi:ribosomal 30S subunit maturation factor RimM